MSLFLALSEDFSVHLPFLKDVLRRVDVMCTIFRLIYFDDDVSQLFSSGCLINHVRPNDDQRFFR